MRARVRAWLSQMQRLFPFRPAGLLLIGVALFLFRFSTQEADYLLYPSALASLALVALCVAFVVAGGWALRRAVRRLDAGIPESLETTHPVPTAFRIPSLRRWLVLDVQVAWAAPLGVVVTLEPVGDWFEEAVTPSQRGRHTRVVRRFTVGDIFGIAAVTFDVGWDSPVRITPGAALCSAELAASRASGDAWSHPSGRAEGDLVEMRSYAHGDSMRHVLWKTFARTRRLLVRTPERAVAAQPVNVAFLVVGKGDEPTAGVARTFIEQGLLGSDFAFSADGALHPTHLVAEAVEQIIDSVDRDGAATLDALAAQVDPARMDACLVFAPAIDGPWRERVINLTRRLGITATVVIGVDGRLEAAAPRGRLERLLTRPDADGECMPAGLKDLRNALEADGLRVQVLHRGTGLLV